MSLLSSQEQCTIRIGSMRQFPGNLKPFSQFCWVCHRSGNIYLYQSHSHFYLIRYNSKKKLSLYYTQYKDIIRFNWLMATDKCLNVKC